MYGKECEFVSKGSNKRLPKGGNVYLLLSTKEENCNEIWKYDFKKVFTLVYT